nr:MAG TPA_asm: hypothetical protein [Caudoviricetes sp.]
MCRICNVRDMYCNRVCKMYVYVCVVNIYYF